MMLMPALKYSPIYHLYIFPRRRNRSFPSSAQKSKKNTSYFSRQRNLIKKNTTWISDSTLVIALSRNVEYNATVLEPSSQKRRINMAFKCVCFLCYLWLVCLIPSFTLCFHIFLEIALYHPVFIFIVFVLFS